MEPSKGINWITALWKMYSFPNVRMASDRHPGLAHRVKDKKLQYYAASTGEWLDTAMDKQDMNSEWVEVSDPDWKNGYVSVDWKTAYALRALHHARGVACSTDFDSDLDAFRVLYAGHPHTWRYNFIMDAAYTNEAAFKFYMRKDLHTKYFSA